jgi:hypothetical protein
MYQNLAILAAFAFIYSAFAKRMASAIGKKQSQ